MLPLQNSTGGGEVVTVNKKGNCVAVRSKSSSNRLLARKLFSLPTADILKRVTGRKWTGGEWQACTCCLHTVSLTILTETSGILQDVVR